MRLKAQFNFWIFVVTIIGHAAFGRAEELRQKAVAPQEVVVIGSQTDAEARRDFVAGKIVIGRKRIEESGLQNVADLLKREPSITVGKDGRMGLLGLPGYTQVLVDGAPPTAGKSLSELDLVHVEKIEILKSSVAEFGPFGIAGTINVVTRKTERKNNAQLRVGVSSVAGAYGSDLAWSFNQSDAGSPLSFSAQISASRKATSDESSLTQTLTPRGLREQAQWQGQALAHNRNSNLTASGSIAWQMDARTKFSFSPGIGAMAIEQDSLERKRWSDDRTPEAHQQTRTPFVQLSLPLSWTYNPDEKSRLELGWNSSRLHSSTEARREESLPATTTVRNNTQNRELDADSLKLNYKVSLASGHDIKAGGYLGRNRESSEYSYWINDVPDTSLGVLGAVRDLRSEQRRLFLQDDWRLNDTLALNYGLSGEESVIDLAEGSYRSRAQYRLWSPSAHLAKKFDIDGKRQVRISVARTYKAPWSDQLTLRPQIHPLAPCAENGQCSTNSIDTADTSGNPYLKPESALGLNISYEHGFGADSQLALELYARAIDRLIGNDILLENVPWSNAPRYVARPANLGDATVQGVDLEMQLSLREIWQGAPKLDLRGSAGLARSQISSLPGPDNHLADQAPWRAKFGTSYAAKNWPLKLSFDANWMPAGWVRNSVAKHIFLARKFNVDANASWKFNSDVRLLVNLDNLFARTSQRIDDYITNDELVSLQTNKTTHTKLAVRLEIKL